MSVQIRAANVDLPLYRGDNYPFGPFTISDSSGVKNYSGASEVKMTIKDKADGTELWSQTATDPSGGNDWVNGIIAFEIADTDSQSINSDSVYDIQVTNDSKKETVMYGKILVQKDVT